MRTAQIFCMGVNHETAPLAIREALACTPPIQQPLLGKHCPQIDEWALLTTCNRVEIYAAATADEVIDMPADILLAHFGDVGEKLRSHIYFYRDREAADHLLHVAAGLDSLVLGEPQILGQVNRAFYEAQEHGSTGPALTALFRAAVAAGKRVRSETDIGKNPASVPSVAINQACQRLGGLQDRDILLVGAGAMAHTAIKALRTRNYARIHVANRTIERASALVAPWGGTAFGLDQLPQALSQADIVFCATHAQRPLLTTELLYDVQAARQHRPLLLFDLAVPRDIDPRVERIPGVSLIDLDHLQADLDESIIARRREIPAAEAIIEQEMMRLEKEMAEIAMRPVIAGLRQKAEEIRQRELKRTLRYLGEVDEATRAHIDHLSHALVNQLLHEPTLRLRREATGEHPEKMCATVCDLFNLDLPEGSSAS